MPAKLGRPKELRRDLLFEGRIFKVARCALRYRNGQAARNDLVLHDGAAVFAPIPRPGRVLLIRQYRHAAGGFLWEIPAGRIERGESPLATAKRELSEECGLRARIWRKAAAFLPAPGYTTEVMHLFLAQDLAPARDGARPDRDEEIETREFSLAQLARAIRMREIRDGKTIVAAFFLGAR